MDSSALGIRAVPEARLSPPESARAVGGFGFNPDCWSEVTKDFRGVGWQRGGMGVPAAMIGGDHQKTLEACVFEGCADSP
jgi:hypothetical protein